MIEPVIATHKYKGLMPYAFYSLVNVRHSPTTFTTIYGYVFDEQKETIVQYILSSEKLFTLIDADENFPVNLTTMAIRITHSVPSEGKAIYWIYLKAVYSIEGDLDIAGFLMKWEFKG